MPVTFAAGTIPPFLTEVVALLVAGAVIAYVCNRFGLVPIVGFLLAGVVIGPNALGLVRDRELVDAAAEVGVILLLFTIGIEFSLQKLARIKRLIFGGGGLQVGLATLLTMGVLTLFGVNWRAGLFTGFLVALSSTAIVLKLLGDRGETNEPQGQVGLGLLIFQDLAIIVMVLLVPMLSGSGGSAPGIGWALLKAGAIIAGVLLFARRLMPKILEMVARTCSPELFLLTVIAICFGTAYLTSLAGVSLSLGAFLAGLLVSESRFSEHALSEIMPLQILFSATFFVSVGMLLDLSFLVQNLPLVLGVVALVLVVKVATTGVSALALGYGLPVAATSGLMLAQVGEFSFVLERAGREVGLSPAGLSAAGSQTFIAATVVLMVLTPLLMQVGSIIARRLERRQAGREAATIAAQPLPEHLPQLQDHVIVAGYGEAARRLVRVLGGSGIPYIITTLSPAGANEAEAEGLAVLRGDASHQRTLQLAGVERAKMVVIADDDPATARRIAAVARTTNPTMRILVRTRYMAEIEPLTETGVDRVIAEELESIVGLFADVLRDYRIAAEEIEAHEEALRRGGYVALLRDAPEGEAAVVECQLPEDCLDTRTVTIRAGAHAATTPLAALALEAKYGIALRTLRRNGEVFDDPPEDFALQAGDELVLHGTAGSFARSAPLFRTQAGSPFEVDPAPAMQGDGGIDTGQLLELKPDAAASPSACAHLGMTRAVRPSARGCEECLRTGDAWVHLRICMTCGHVGCCDSSKNKHASKHYPATEHPIVKSLERGEDWAWCYPDETYL
ncbi:MAG TPA: cation:proton antiporter [Pyrinomonadaceae bacterium]|nr:cation:proton antiporter [Pyrinomonadaceae bacterium]